MEASAVIEEMGFTIYDDLVHGYGGGYLPPVLGSKSRPNLPVPDLTLEEGMALVIQPDVITTDERAGVQTGHLVVVTADGYRSLARRPPRTRPNRMIGLAKNIPGSDQIAVGPASRLPNSEGEGWTRIVPRIGCSRLNLWLACKRLG